MQVTTLHEVEEALRSLDLGTLREMAYQLGRSHAAVCRITSKLGEAAHVSEQETRDRVDQLGPAELTTILAPTAWLSVKLHAYIHG
jgi:hypothetical protein